MLLSIYDLLVVYVDTVAMVPSTKESPEQNSLVVPLLLAALHVSVHNYP